MQVRARARHVRGCDASSQLVPAAPSPQDSGRTIWIGFERAPRRGVAEWERNVRAVGAEIFSQDRCGAVRIEMREDDGLVVQSFLGGQIIAKKQPR